MICLAKQTDFGRSIMIGLQGAKISSNTGFLFLREMTERFDIFGPTRDCLKDRRPPVHARHSLEESWWPFIGGILC